MKIWFRYLRERRYVILLYFLTAFLFVFMGSLYHLENLGKLLYAALLTFVVWAVAGFLDGLRYVQKSRQLEEAALHFEQSGDLIIKEYGGKSFPAESGSVREAEELEEAWYFLSSQIFEKKERDRMRWEERTAECRDYYTMWTHQIKTPISAMRLLLENGEAHDRNDFLMREELFKIEQYAEMALTFQRLESISSDLVVQEYDLGTMLKNAVKKYAVLFINKGLGVELQEMELKVLTDEKWFGFCVEQLLSNSIKYTPEGTIVFRAELSEGEQPGEKKAILYMEDTGIGIRPEDLPRIFEKGFTGYNGRLDKKSTGIGLYMCRKIFLHLGIHVRAESERGKGTRMILTLPCTDHDRKLPGN